MYCRQHRGRLNRHRNQFALLAVIFSTGSDGVANGDNNNGDTVYVDGEYVVNVRDDVLVWLSKNTFYNRLAEAGKPVP